jgi:putative salt-induced outer membrane protein YdiY
MRKTLVVSALAFGLALAAPANAQTTCPCPEEPPPGWRAKIGAGLSFTGGNKESRNVSLSFEAVYDPKTKNLFKADGLWIRTESDGELSADRVNTGARDEYTISKRAYLFGEARYLRDRFKDLTYLITPLAGVGYRLVDTEKTTLALDLAVGGAFEKQIDQDATSDGSFRAGQSFSLTLSPSAKLTQSGWGLWKMSDTADAFYHFEVALAVSMARRLELQVAFFDDYKNKPANPTLQKNDTAFVVNFVFKK